MTEADETVAFVLCEGDECPCGCGNAVVRCGCDDEAHLVCEGCGNDAEPDEDGDVSCDCVSGRWWEEEGWSSARTSMEWFREQFPKEVYRVVAPHCYGPWPQQIELPSERFL